MEATKKKAGRPKAPPAPPALGIAERSGDGWKFTIVLGGLKVNGKKFDPQAGAEVLAGMLEDGMKRLTPAARSAPSPEKALADLEATDAAGQGTPPEPAMLANRATNDDAAGGIAATGEPDRPARNGDADVRTAESGDARAPAIPAMAPGATAESGDAAGERSNGNR